MNPSKHIIQNHICRQAMIDNTYIIEVVGQEVKGSVLASYKDSVASTN